MALRTQYIENRDYSAQEILDIVNKYNVLNWQVGSVGALLGYIHPLCVPITLSAAIYHDQQSILEINDIPDTKYSGLEITNFLNEFGKLSIIRPGYTEKKLELINHLLNHEYNNKDVLTYDQIGYMSWPYAVLMSNKEDVERDFAIEHPDANKGEPTLVSALDISSDIL